MRRSFKNSWAKLFFVLLLANITDIAAIETFTPRALLIFLDESEQTIDAISGSLIAALGQKAGPLVATQSLIQNIFSGYPPTTSQSDDDIVQDFEALMRTIAWTPASVTNAMQKQLKTYFQLALQPLMSEWIIKEISEGFYLFLPAGMAVKSPATALAKDAPLSELELTLGLKIDHMKTISLEEILKQKRSSGKSFLSTVLMPEKNRSALFCLRQDYAGKKQESLPSWGISMDGHGKMRESIAGMKIAEFNEALTFFSESINTALLIYRSCYAAGVNIEEVFNGEMIFKDKKFNIKKTYSFPIITQAITDAPVMENMPRVAIIDGKLGIESVVKFASFVDAINSNSFSDYRKITEFLFPLLPRENIGLPKWANVPQIKLPGVEWFSVLASQKDIVAIGRTLVQSRNPSKPLSIQKFFKTDPKALLIYTRTIPFTVILDGKNLEAIISMIPGDAIHIFENITAAKSVSDVVELFGQSIYMLDPRKIFLIKKLNDTYTNVVIHNIMTPGKLGASDIYTVEAFFEKDGDVEYARIDPTLPITFSPASPSQKDTYNRLISEALGTINTIEGYSFESDRTANNLFKPMQSPTIIKRITGKNSASIGEIFIGITPKLTPQAAVLIEEMNAPYDALEITIPGKKEGEMVTINNLLIRKTGPIYFQYDGKFYKGKSGEVSNEEYAEKYKAAFGSVGAAEPVFPYKEIEAVLSKKAKPAAPHELAYLAEALSTLSKKIGDTLGLGMFD